MFDDLHNVCSLEYRQATVKRFPQDGATNLENSLTPKAHARRIERVENNGLRRYLSLHLGENPNKTELAHTTGLPYYVVVDIFRGKTQRPDPSVLESLALGLSVPYDELALAAYGKVYYPDPAGADDTLEKGAPPASNRAWTQTGRPLRRASAATS